MRLAGKRIARIESSPITPNATLVTQRLMKRLPQRDAAVFNCVVGVHLKITFTGQFKIHHRVLGKERQHVVKKGNTRVD